MQRYLPLLVLSLIMIGCQQTKQLEKVDTSQTDQFILDSLLLFESEDQLIKNFGAENIQRDTGYYPEAIDSYLMTVLFPKTNKQVELTWNDSVTFSSLSTVTINHPESVWKTAEGIGVGTTLQELIIINQKDVEFSGLGWDYGGLVNWGDGVLQNRGINVTLDASEDSYNSKAVLDSLFGDQIVSSKSPLARSAGLKVTEVSLIKQHE